MSGILVCYRLKKVLFFLNLLLYWKIIFIFKQVETISTSSGNPGRRKRLASIPGYKTAQFQSGELTQEISFVVGDNQTYGGYLNKPLTPGKTYRIHYAAVNSANNETKVIFFFCNFILLVIFYTHFLRPS